MSVLSFPKRAATETRVETPMMRRAAKRTLAVHPGGAVVVWTGPPRAGKTTTARWLVGELAAMYSPSDENAFQALHYEIGEISSRSGHEGKKAIRSLHNQVFGSSLDPGSYMQDPAESLAERVVRGAIDRNLQMVFVDEAGLLSVNALRGLILARDVAENEGWTLTFVLIGMDDLPKTVAASPQVDGRVHEWVFFQPYELEDTWKLLRELHPYFAGLDPVTENAREQVQFIQEISGGLPGQIVPFVKRFDYRIRQLDGEEPDMVVLRGVHLSMVRDRERAEKAEKSGWLEAHNE